MNLSNASDTRVLRKLYWGKRMSIRQTAIAIGMSYQGTRKRLQKVGSLRTKSAGKMKYERRPFTNDRLERSYLLGLRAGDINAWKKSPNTIEARVSTTHPAMSNLFAAAFDKYGHLMRFAERAYLPGRFRWQTKAHLDSSFRFLVSKPRAVPREAFEFYGFLGGYSDSEGCWSLYPQSDRIRVSWTIETYDGGLVKRIGTKLHRQGFHPLLYRSDMRASGGKNQKLTQVGRIKFRLAICRTDEVVALARILMSLSLHSEKIEKMRLILAHPRGKWSEIESEVKRLRRTTRSQALRYQKKAERAYNNRRSGWFRNGVVG